MSPLRLSRIEIFLRMRRGTLRYKRCADAASGHIIHNISKVRGARLFTRSGELWCLKFSCIFHDQVIQGQARDLCLKWIASLCLTGRSRHQARTLYDVLKSRNDDLL